MRLSEEMEIIAEVGQAHNGKIEQAHSYIKALAQTGIDTVKFQIHIAEAESSIYEPFRVPLNFGDKTRFDYWKRMEFSFDQWKEIKAHCEDLGLNFLASPFSNAAVDILEELGVKRYKIGSGEVNNFLLLEKIARTGKPILLSSGMSSIEELDLTVDFLRKHRVAFSIFQCTTAYPTEPENYGLNVIGELMERYGVQIGFSDHSGRIEPCIAATAVGAELLEFHAVFDRKSDLGPDASSSLEMEEIKQLVRSVRTVREALRNPIDKFTNQEFSNLKGIFEKSLAVNKNLEPGHVIEFGDLEAKKPKGYGLDPTRFNEVLGRKLVRPKQRWDFLDLDDLT